MSSQIFSELDTIEEDEMLQLSTFLRVVLKEVPVLPAIEDDDHVQETASKRLDDIKIQSIGSAVHSKMRMEDDHQLHKTKPIDMPMAVEVIELFRSGGSLHKSSIMRILRKAYPKLKDLRNLVPISVPSEGKLTVVGDIHGQLPDLLHILDESGLPSSTNKYIFNG